MLMCTYMSIQFQTFSPNVILKGTLFTSFPRPADTLNAHK